MRTVAFLSARALGSPHQSHCLKRRAGFRNRRSTWRRGFGAVVPVRVTADLGRRRRITDPQPLCSIEADLRLSRAVSRVSLWQVWFRRRRTRGGSVRPPVRSSALRRVPHVSYAPFGGQTRPADSKRCGRTRASPGPKAILPRALNCDSGRTGCIHTQCLDHETEGG